jgi:hypothetical protein
MGLLKRAASIGLVLRQSAPGSVPTKAQGLLYKTISALKNGTIHTHASLFWRITPIEDEGVDTEQIPEQVKQELAGCAGGIISPYLFFNRVREHLGLAHAALFLLDRLQNTYRPWAWFGISADAAAGMSLAAPGPEVFHRLSGGRPFVLPADSPYKIIPEQEELSPCMLAPVIYRQNLIALFVVFNAEEKAYDIPRLTEFLAAACRFASPLLYEQRERLLSAYASPLPLHWQDRGRTIAVLYGECRRERLPLYVLVITAKSLTENIRSGLGCVDPDCFYADLLLLVNSLLCGLGAAYPHGDRNIVIFFKGYNSLDPDLLLHQIFSQIKSLYDKVSAGWKLRLPEKPTTLFEEEKDLQNVLSDYL